VSTPTDTQRSADEARILDLHTQWVAANRTAEAEFLPTVMAPDVLMFNLNGSNYVGLEHLASFWRTARDVVHAKMGDSKVVSRGAEVHVVGDLAWVTDEIEYSSDFSDMGMERVDQSIRGTEVWQRIEGEWRIVHCHFSMHVPGRMGGV
jgi:uncharacterized protein (TIGR02246 family)